MCICSTRFKLRPRLVWFKGYPSQQTSCGTWLGEEGATFLQKMFKTGSSSIFEDSGPRQASLRDQTRPFPSVNTNALMYTDPRERTAISSFHVISLRRESSSGPSLRDGEQRKPLYCLSLTMWSSGLPLLCVNNMELQPSLVQVGRMALKSLRPRRHD